MSRTTCVLAAAALLAAGGRAAAFEEPYCGLYSMHAALHSLGIKADMGKLIAPEYLSGSHGSTASDLIKLAAANGAVGTYRTKMTLADLRAATSPVILHTSVAVSKSGYHHWVLFLGMDGDGVKLYDPPRGRYTLPGSELLTHWDGIGVVVSAAPPARSVPRPDSELLLAGLLVLVSGVAVTRLPVVRGRPVLGFVVAAVGAGAGWHAVVDHGFLNRSATASVATRHDSSRVPEIPTDEFVRAVTRPDVTVVDARRPVSFRLDRIPGAINIPVTVTHGDLRAALAEIPTSNLVVVYCQNDECEWADEVARQFPARGYRNVRIFRGGMTGWKQLPAKPL